MKINDQYVVRRVAGEYILVPLTGDFDFNGIISFNEMGRQIFDLLPKVQTQEELVDRLFEIYDAPREVITEDASAFLAQLREEKILLD
ncbi:MAG: PqqD family protein [Ruminococcaceae bacterium]|nr:PqqD family protein [Oscillospiraceae bacterium]